MYGRASPGVVWMCVQQQDSQAKTSDQPQNNRNDWAGFQALSCMPVANVLVRGRSTEGALSSVQIVALPYARAARVAIKLALRGCCLGDKLHRSHTTVSTGVRHRESYNEQGALERHHTRSHTIGDGLEPTEPSSNHRNTTGSSETNRKLCETGVSTHQ